MIRGKEEILCIFLSFLQTSRFVVIPPSWIRRCIVVSYGLKRESTRACWRLYPTSRSFTANEMLLSFLPFTSLSSFQLYMRILHAVDDQRPSDDALEALMTVCVCLSESSKAVILNGAGTSTNAGLPVSLLQYRPCMLSGLIETRYNRTFEAKVRVHLESTLNILLFLPRPDPVMLLLTQPKNYSPTPHYSNPTRVQLISSSWRIFIKKDPKLV